MSEILKAIVIGAGDRGADTYGKYALRNPKEIKFIAVAEPIEVRRNIFKQQHEINEENCFTTWEDILSKEKFADIAVITTQDKMHFEPAILAMERGYDVLLEKPMAVSIQDCKELVEVAERTGKILQIGHVLRYTEFFSKIKEIISSGKLGDIANISLRENVSSFHYAHSYIRGHWRNREETSPMVLAKSCHDLDILYWFIGSKTKKISSFGSQAFFGKNNQPKGAPDRCLEGCPVSDSCLYYAPRIYIDIEPLLQASGKGGPTFDKLISKIILRFPKIKNLSIFKKVREYNGWPVNVISNDLTFEGKMKALRETNFGKCVYTMNDHTVVDHQVVNIEFENNVTAVFTLHGFSHEEGRTLRIDGTKGTIVGEFLISGEKIKLFNAHSGKETLIHQDRMISGHGGGDDRLMTAFIYSVKNQTKEALSRAREALESHLMAFASDISRIEERIVEMEELRK
ncbi:MAG: Gfo/Idh/MocA family oxidoreductase [Candidatus Heimdallarchaeota archaeon]|nr:Gfo/Idh/MocA family oxidoreductase [Candidatus Heimdallarchaeota archaeon]